MAKYEVGITEKRLKNRRFRKTEEAILKVFFEEDNYISLGEMAEKVGIARSTIYRHHKTVRGIVLDYRNFILRKYKSMTRKLKGVGLEVAFERMILFMIRNKKVFEVLLKNEDAKVLKEMIMFLKPEVFKYAKLPKNFEKGFLVYMNEVVGLIEKWTMEEFDEAKVGILLSDIGYLTDTLRQRLKGLVDN